MSTPVIGLAVWLLSTAAALVIVGLIVTWLVRVVVRPVPARSTDTARLAALDERLARMEARLEQRSADVERLEAPRFTSAALSHPVR